LRATIHITAVTLQEVPVSGIPDKSASVKTINRYLRCLSDQQLKYYADQGITKAKIQIQYKPLLNDLRSGTITASLAYTILTNQFDRDDLIRITDRLSNEIDFLCGESDPITELWEALDTLTSD
jgi:hypothetical protein